MPQVAKLTVAAVAVLFGAASAQTGLAGIVDHLLPPPHFGQPLHEDGLLYNDRYLAGLASNRRAGLRGSALQGMSALPKKLSYYGGPVLKNVKVTPIYWNAEVAYQSELNQFYADFVQSSVFTTLLPQYGGISTGTMLPPYVDNQPVGAFTDAQLQAHLRSLFVAGVVPQPDQNTLYAFHFPANVDITAADGSQSCVVWCAYHGTFVYNGYYVAYSVVPDQGGGCAGGCGGNAQRVNNVQSVASHELVEAVTDPAVGVATTYGPPLGWYSSQNGEIGDICNGQQSIVTVDGTSYVVQKEWSNNKVACATT